MKRENFRGAIMGLAVGDALGATTEFMNEKDIKEKYDVLKDIVGGGWLDLQPGEITDDTEMTICVANGILENPEDPIDSIGKHFLQWLKSNPKDIGTTTRCALYSYKGDWEEASYNAYKTLGQGAGNGSLMRCLPIALAYSDRNKVIELSFFQSRMTHYDFIAGEACVLYNLIAYEIMNGMNLKEAIEKNILGTKYEEVLKNDPNCSPSGFVVDTFKCVLRVLLTTNNYEDVVVKLTNMGGDADTTAAIAGGLAGLYYGYNNIPSKFKDKIILKKQLIELADKLYDLRISKTRI